METQTQKKPTKTMQEWLDELPFYIRTQAIFYNEKQGYTHRLEMEFVSGVAAFSLAFDGNNTPEGSDYWTKAAVEFYKPVFNHG